MKINHKVGVVYVGDASTMYTNNFIEALSDIEQEYNGKVEIVSMYNVAEGTERDYLERLVSDGCNMIFSTSYNYGVTTKELAQKYPEVQFCMATCSNANEEPYLKIIIHLWEQYIRVDMPQVCPQE